MKSAEKGADVLIIGGGPAGLSTAVWCADLGLRAVLFEMYQEAGGQLLWTHNPITNYLGATAENGRELRDIFLRQVNSADVELINDAEVASVDLTRGLLNLANGDVHSAPHIVIATGVRRRRLGIPGEMEFRGSGVLESGVRDRSSVMGKRVVVIGGGDAALENAILLGEVAEHVTVVHRREKFAARPEFLNAAGAARNIELMTGQVAKAIAGNERVEEISIADSTCTMRSIACDAVLVRIGVEPNTALVRDQIKLDARGYIEVDDGCRTSLPNVFAAGDVASPGSPTISTAVGMGAAAAKFIVADLRNEAR